MPLFDFFSRRAIRRDDGRGGDALPHLEQTLKIYDLFRDYLKHEDDLRSTRTGWLLTSQAFLFAAIGTMLTSKDAPESIRFYFELFIAALGFLIALNHRQRAKQQDAVYVALEAGYAEVRERLWPAPRGWPTLLDLPPLRYAGARAAIGALPYSVSYHALFMLAWLVLIGLFAGAKWHVPASLFPSPSTTATPRPPGPAFGRSGHHTHTSHRQAPKGRHH